MKKVKSTTALLGGLTAALTLATMPLATGDSFSDSAPIAQMEGFSFRGASGADSKAGSGCNIEGKGCAITIFEDGFATVADVR